MSVYNEPGAIHAIQASGFTLQGSPSKAVQGLLPFRGLSSPQHCTLAASGQLGGRQAWLFCYEYGTVNYHEGEATETTWRGAFVAVEHGAPITSPVSIRQDWKASRAGAVMNALLWIPPFTFVKAFQYAKAADNPDHEIGNKEFDHRYLVHADSEKAARDAIPQPLGELLVGANFQGMIEIRPGWALLAYDTPAPGAEGVRQLLGFAAEVAARLAPPATAQR